MMVKAKLKQLLQQIMVVESTNQMKALKTEVGNRSTLSINQAC
jgi:hypothetical protein